jgi:hypothetical protein
MGNVNGHIFCQVLDFVTKWNFSVKSFSEIWDFDLNFFYNDHYSCRTYGSFIVRLLFMYTCETGREASSCNALEISHLRMRIFEEYFVFLMTGT